MFPFDETTREYLKGRTDKPYEPVAADAGAHYEKEIVLDVDAMPFVVAKPHQFGNVGPVEEAAPWIDHYWANRPFFSRAVEHDLVAMLMSGMKPAEAAARWRDYPVTGPLDARPTGWKRVADRLATLIGAPGRADD